MSLKGRDYTMARAVPGAFYSSELKCMVLRNPSPRSAIVALQLFPDLGNEYPELEELRAELIQDVTPTDYATQLGIEINAPIVHQTLLDQGSDWLEFPEHTGFWEKDPDADGTKPIHPTQSTDLGFIAAQLDRIGGGYLGWARGYGKTLGTAAIIEANGYKTSLVAVPNTAKEDVWRRELERRLPHHGILVLGNTKASRESALKGAYHYFKSREPFVLIVHHESLALIAGKRERKSGKGYTILDGWKRLGILWDLFAVDEAHKLKNPESQVHRAACKVPSDARLALSGSVYENSWEEPYGPLHWLFPKTYRGKWDSWNLRFLDYVEGYGKVCVGILPGREQALRDELGVFMVVREKPDKSLHWTRRVDLNPAQRRAYDSLRDDLVAKLDDGTLVVAEAGVVMLTRLRQLASGLELISKRIADSSKLDAAVELIQQLPDHDFFVACWYKASAYALQSYLLRSGIPARVITGDVPMKQRGPIIQASREDAGRHAAGPDWPQAVLIGTIPTLGESANLQHLNHVVRIDRSFNPALNRQVVDRCDRTGQTRQVHLTDIVAADTVDELVVAPNLANKDAFRAMILGRAA